MPPAAHVTGRDVMPRYILTGTPGAGKTAILRQLELDGYRVVEEAATDIIALQHALGEPEPWRTPSFVDKVVALQRSRQLRAGTDTGRTTFFDRSPLCTLALCRHLALTAPRHLLNEVERVVAEHVYERTVFFVRNLGFVHATPARRISFEDSLAFEHIHELTYREFGFELVEVPAAALPARVAIVRRALDLPASPRSSGEPSNGWRAR
jgi:predicted ATPase